MMWTRLDNAAGRSDHRFVPG